MYRGRSLSVAAGRKQRGLVTLHVTPPPLLSTSHCDLAFVYSPDPSLPLAAVGHAFRLEGKRPLPCLNDKGIKTKSMATGTGERAPDTPKKVFKSLMSK